jgi:peptidoglycan pentaglycine glycine transferase (the first glycine)
LSLQFVSPSDADWDAFVEAGGGHILQTAAWGALKSRFGWRAERVALADEDNRLVAGAQILFRRLPLGLGSLAYVPRGPLIDWNDEAQLTALLAALDERARAGRAALLKLEPDADDTPALRQCLAGLGLRPSPHTVQPPRTILLDITGSEDDVLARMSQKTRYNIRLAYRKDVLIRRGDTSDLDSFNRLMSATGERDEFAAHSPDYYRAAYELFAPQERVALLIASYQGVDLAGLMAFALGRTAWYFYGASSDQERNRMPTYALQWEAIRWARSRGCSVYDLWGVPDHDQATLEAHFAVRSAGLWGVYRFKRGFGGQVWRTVGAWDRVYNLPLYQAYRLIAARLGQ